MTLIRSITTLLFGALPATFLCLWASWAIALGASALADGDGWPSALVFIWGIAGILGTASLWAASFRPISRIVAVGLIIGLIACAPVAAISMEGFNLDSPIWLYFFQIAAISASLVAIGQLAIRYINSGRITDSETDL